jgi:hypothetical protein
LSAIATGDEAIPRRLSRSLQFVIRYFLMKGVKKVNQDWAVALTYYIAGNLIGLVPSAAAAFGVNAVARTVWQYLVLELAVFVVILFFSFRLSAANINRNYVVASPRSITNWTVGYLFVFNLAFFVIVLLGAGRLTASSLAGLLNLAVAAIMITACTPRFITKTLDDEAEVAKKVSAMTEAPVRGVGSQLVRTAFVTVGGIMFLIFAPFVGYFVMVTEPALPSWAVWLIIGIWEAGIIILAQRLLFSRPKAKKRQ